MKNHRVLALLAAVVVVGGSLGIADWKAKREHQTAITYVAKTEILPHTKIEENMLQQVEVEEKSIPPGAIRKKDDILNKWTQVHYGIPQNGYFFESKVVTEEKLLDSERMKLKQGQKILTIDVDIERSASGNVIPDSLVEVWWVSKTKSGKTVSGRLYQNLLCLSTKNKKAEDVVQKNLSTAETSTNKTSKSNGGNSTQKELFPTIVDLSVNEEQYRYIRAAETMGKVYLVPQGGRLLTAGDPMPASVIDDPVSALSILKQNIAGDESDISSESASQKEDSIQ